MRFSTIVTVLLQLTCGLSLPRSSTGYEGSRPYGSSFGLPGNKSFDYVIVGGGNAGLTLAARLSKNYTVAVIEAGGFYELGNGNLSQIPGWGAFFTGKDPKDVNPLVDWGFVTTPQAQLKNDTAHFARGKTLGGCTGRNFMSYMRSTKQAYQKWADDVGDASFSFDNLLPFFQKSIHYTPPDMTKRAINSTVDVDAASIAASSGRDNPVSVTFPNYAQPPTSWIQMGFEEIGLNPTNGHISGNLLGSAYSLATINATTQTRESSETSFLTSALDQETLTVYISSLAKKVVFDDNKVATGVEVETSGIPYTLSAKREVIVSAGAFQSPQLLMVSGVGPKDTLCKYKIPVIADRPGVGQNMWDHVLLGITYRMNVLTASSLGDPKFLLQAETEYRENQTGMLTNPGGDWFAFEKIPESYRKTFTPETQEKLAKFPADWPDIEFFSTTGLVGLQQNYIRDGPTDGYQYATVSVGVVAPSSRGSVDITSADMADPPVIDPNWLSDPADRELLIAGFKRVRQLFATKAMQPVLIGSEYFPGPEVQSDEEILDVIQRATSTVYHPSCTCAMGKIDDPKAVVDSRARVIGVKSLRVVDASAFPFLPPGHPMGTVYALAEKIASDILLNP